MLRQECALFFPKMMRCPGDIQHYIFISMTNKEPNNFRLFFIHYNSPKPPCSISFTLPFPMVGSQVFMGSHRWGHHTHQSWQSDLKSMSLELLVLNRAVSEWLTEESMLPSRQLKDVPSFLMKCTLMSVQRNFLWENCFHSMVSFSQ